MLGCGEDRGQACDTGRHQNEFLRLRPVSQILASASSTHLRRSQPMAYSHMRTHESICSWTYMFCAKWTNRYARGRPPLSGTSLQSWALRENDRRCVVCGCCVSAYFSISSILPLAERRVHKMAPTDSISIFAEGTFEEQVCAPGRGSNLGLTETHLD